MMQNGQSLDKIESSAASLLAVIRRIKQQKEVTQLDLDLLLQETRDLYGQMLRFTPAPLWESPEHSEPVQEIEEPVQEKQETLPEEKPSVSEEQEKIEENVIAAPETSPEPENVVEDVVDEPQPTSEPETTEPVAEKEDITTDEELPSDEPKTLPEEEQPESAPMAEEEQEIEQKTTLDLFSETPEDSLGTAYTKQKQQVVGEVLKSSVGDLREAIGINDKFLFINELFNGDMSRYNKLLDELNQFAGLPGALTYLSELSVQYNWKKDQQAYQRLQELLEKKYA